MQARACLWRNSAASGLVKPDWRPHPSEFSHLLILDANTGETRRLTDPDVIPFKIGNGEWAVSPDGRHVAFVKSEDRNIWLLTLID